MGFAESHPFSLAWLQQSNQKSPVWRGAVEAQYFDLGGHDLRWPGQHRKARHRNFLRTVDGIGDHTAGDRAAELLAPKFLAVGGIERIEVAA
jgi:hypothetical protein